MRFKLTILLLILNAALFSLIFYIDRVQSTRSLFESSSRLILDPAFVQGLQKIRIVSRQTDAVWEFQHTDEDDWIVNTPVHWKANPYAIHQLVFQLKELSWDSRFPISDLPQAGQSLDSYNLAAPPLQIELFNGSSSLTIALGAPTEIGNRLYTLSPDGDYVLVIGRGLLEMLQRDMETFLDHRIFGTGIEGSRVIQIQDRSASNVRVRLERRESGWRFVSPIEAEADGERIQAMIAEWQSLEADRFENAGDGQPAMDTNSNALRLTFEGLNKRETLILTPLDGEGGEGITTYRAKREAYGATFTVPAAQVKELRRAQEDLRERRVLLRHAEDWTSLKLQFGELNTTLQQLENGTWQVLFTDEQGELKSQPADREAIDGMHSLLKTLEAVRFISDAPSETDMIRFGLTAPQRRLTLRKASGAMVELMIGGLGSDEDRTLLYATTNQSASVFLIRPHVLASMPLNPLHYRERTIRNLPDTASMESVQLVDRSTGIDLLTSREGGDPGDLPEYLGRYLRTTRVEQFLNERFADPYPMNPDREMGWPYLITGEVRYPSAQSESVTRIELYLSERLGGTLQYVGDPETGLVGTIPISLIESLDPWLVSFPEDPGLPESSPETEGDPIP